MSSSSFGSAALTSAISFYETHAEELEAAYQDRSTEPALELARQHIVERGLILFGGLSIDYALRLQGRSLYPDSELPDYDVYSTDNVKDAYDLGDRLVAAGFQNVSVIRAIHSQTMRVRVGGVSVLDCGHVPSDIFERIGRTALSLRGVRFVHPNVQRMDMHLAMCYPYKNPPEEDVFNRWTKDLRRLNMFEESYPFAARGEVVSTASGDVVAASGDVVAVSAVAASGREDGVAVFTWPLAEVNAPYAVSGLVAYAAAAAWLDKFQASSRKKVRVAELRFADGVATLTVRQPGLECLARRIIIVSPDPESVVSELQATGVERYNPYLDTLPERFEFVAGHSGWCVYSTRGSLFAASSLEVGDGSICLATPHFTMLQFLAGHNFGGHEEERAANGVMYRAMLDLVAEAEELMGFDEFVNSPFAPTVDVIPADRKGPLANASPAYLIRIANAIAATQDASPPEEFRSVGDILEGLPKNYYPSESKPRPPPYDYNHPLFRRSGEKSAE